MRTSRVWWLSLVTLLLMVLPGLLLGQTGKIRGTVVDSKGEAIIGANVVVENTSKGAATDLEGMFFIVALPVGVYDVKASSVGYHPMTISQVQVNSDQTTVLEFELQESTVALKEVVVVFEAPTVDLGVTSNRRVIDSDVIDFMPSDDVTKAILTTPGFKLDEEGKIHIRGGRDTEARFIVDGLDSRDPITGEILPINLAAVNVQEIQILTGGMAAEYGNATSGIVTITTPEGAPDRYNGTLTWTTDMPTGELFDDFSFNEDRVDFAAGGPVPFTKDFMGRPLTFYITSNVKLTDTYTPLNIDYGSEDYIGLGIDLPRRQFNDWSTSLKLAYDLGRGKKLSVYLSQRKRVYDVYPEGSGFVSGNYGWQYLHNLENRPQAEDKRSSFNIDFTNQISQNTVLNFSVGRQILHASLSPRGKTPGEFTLVDEIEEDIAYGLDQNLSGRWDQDADNDGVVHSEGYDELAFDDDGNNFLDGYYDYNGNLIYEGGGEGYEDLNLNGVWDRGEDWLDINGNGVYDYAEPWTDRADPVTGQNNIGVYDPWDPYVDLNNNGVWDPAEEQLPEQDWNNNGRWDGERFQDANNNGIFDRWEPFQDLNGNGTWDAGEPFTDLNGNGRQDDGEGYDDVNLSGSMDSRDIIHQGTGGLEDDAEPYLDGDVWYDTGEPFEDLPDPNTGLYNGRWDPGEPFWDLPSSDGMILLHTWGLGDLPQPTLNGQYDPPNGVFDEYELFTRPNPDFSDSRFPVIYTHDLEQHGADWVNGDYLRYDSFYSTWQNRTINDEDDPYFDVPNYSYDQGQESYIDYNGNGRWNNQDLFLNPGTWDNSAIWSRRKTEEYNLKFSWQSQVHKYHEFKAGTEVHYRIMNQQEIQSPDQEYTGEASVDSDEPWADRGDVRDFWEYKPWQGAVYVQDKMEFEGLIVQAGMRSDFVIHDQNVVDETRRRVAEGEPGAVEAERSNFQFAPRLGISHPITAQSKLYFNYGHFYQTPSFIYYYKATTTNLDQGTVGNPNLDFEKTVTYEIGVHTQVTDDWSFQVAGYYRDMYDLISTISEKIGPVTIYRYVNLDYGRARGLEMKIDKSFSNHFQMTMNYDFSYAYGKASSAHAEFERRSLNVPVNYDEHPLDWDETHRITYNWAMMYGEGEHPVLFGFRLPDYWLLSIQWSFGSGRPYTPSEYTTGINPNLILENSERMPWTETTSLKYEKYWNIGVTKAIVGVEIRNLFDKKNWNSIYSETGSTTYAIHPLNPDYNPFIDRYEYDANPRNYGAGRQILLKVGFEF